MVMTITTDNNSISNECTTNNDAISNSIINQQQKSINVDNDDIHQSYNNDNNYVHISLNKQKEKNISQHQQQETNQQQQQQQQQQEQEQKENVLQVQCIKQIIKNMDNDNNNQMATVDIKRNNEEREEGEIIDEFEDISSDEEILMMKRIEELEARNAELEKIENISGIYDYDIDYVNDRYQKTNSSAKYDYKLADDDYITTSVDDYHTTSYLTSNKKHLTTLRRSSPLVFPSKSIITEISTPITASTTTKTKFLSPDTVNRDLKHHRRHHHHHHHYHYGHKSHNYKTISHHHDIYNDYDKEERDYIYSKSEERDYLSPSSPIESIHLIKHRKRKRKYEKVSKNRNRKTAKSEKKKKKSSRNQISIVPFSSDEEDNAFVLDRDELRKALKRDVTTNVGSKESKSAQNYYRNNEENSKIGINRKEKYKDNKEIRTIDLISDEEKLNKIDGGNDDDDTNITTIAIINENDEKSCDIEDVSDDSASLEEQELRLIALKSAIEQKHLKRKCRRESDDKRPYSPSDNFVEMFDLCMNDSNKDLYSFSPSDIDISPPPISPEITDTYANNSMDISPISSPELIINDNGGCDRVEITNNVDDIDANDSVLKPIDMEIANSDSSNCPSPIFEQQQHSQQNFNLYENNWIPIEKIPLPNDCNNLYHQENRNQEIQQSHHIHSPTAVKLLPSTPLVESFVSLMSSLSSSSTLLQQQQQQLQQQQQNTNVDDNEKVVILRSSSSLESDIIDDVESTDEEESALRALLLANMNSIQKTKSQEHQREELTEKNVENQLTINDNSNNNSIKEDRPPTICTYNKDDTRNCDINPDDSSTSSFDIEILKDLILKTMNNTDNVNGNNNNSDNGQKLQQNHEHKPINKTEFVLKEAVKRLKQKTTTAVNKNPIENESESLQKQQSICDKNTPSSSILKENINSTKELLPDTINNDIKINSKKEFNDRDIENMVDIFEKVNFNENRKELNYKESENLENVRNNNEKNEYLPNDNKIKNSIINTDEIKNKKSINSVQKINKHNQNMIIKPENQEKIAKKLSITAAKSISSQSLSTTTPESNKIPSAKTSNNTKITKTRTKIINNNNNTATETNNTQSLLKKRKIIRATTVSSNKNQNENNSLSKDNIKESLKITQNLKTGTRLVTKADIPKIEKIIIQLGAESSSSSSECESDYENDIKNNDLKNDLNDIDDNNSSCNYYYNDNDNASPMSLQMDSPVYSPIPNQNQQSSSEFQNSDNKSIGNGTEKNVTNDIFQAKLDEFLKNARIKVEQNKKEINTNDNSISNNINNSNSDSNNFGNNTIRVEKIEKPAVKTTEFKLASLKAIASKTPVAVRHLPQSSQLEYRRLVNRMKTLEKQKLARSTKMNVNRDNLKVTIKMDEGENDSSKLMNESTTQLTSAISTTVPLKETIDQRLNITDSCNTSNSNNNSLLERSSNDIINSNNENMNEINQQKDTLIKKVLIKNASTVVSSSLSSCKNDNDNDLLKLNNENEENSENVVIMNQNEESPQIPIKLEEIQDDNVNREKLDIEKSKENIKNNVCIGSIENENILKSNLEENKNVNSSSNSNNDGNKSENNSSSKSHLEMNKNKMELLKKYENEYNNKSCDLYDNITKTIDLISLAKKEKSHKLLLQKKFEQLKIQMKLIENDLDKQNKKLSKIYPDIMNSHKKILNIKTNYINLERITMNLGRNLYGNDYRIKNDNKKSMILDKSKQFSIEINKLKDLKQSDLNENVTLKWIISEKSPQKENTMTMITKTDKENELDSNENDIGESENLIDNKIGNIDLNISKDINKMEKENDEEEVACKIIEENKSEMSQNESLENKLESMETDSNRTDTVNAGHVVNKPSSEECDQIDNLKTSNELKNSINDVVTMENIESESTTGTGNSLVKNQKEINLQNLIALKNIEVYSTETGIGNNLKIISNLESSKSLEKIEKNIELFNDHQSNDNNGISVTQKEKIDKNFATETESKHKDEDKQNEKNVNEEDHLISTELIKNYISPLDHIKQDRTIDDPNGIICPYQLMGQCDDKECKFVHLPNNDE